MLTDKEIVLLYSLWSEEVYCAGFMIPDESTVSNFRAWLQRQEAKKLKDYEKEMLEIYHRQERPE